MQSTAFIDSLTRNKAQEIHKTPDDKIISEFRNALIDYLRCQQKLNSCSDFKNGLLLAESLKIASLYDVVILKGTFYLIQRSYWLTKYDYERKDKKEKTALGVMVGWNLTGKKVAIKIKPPTEKHKKLNQVIKVVETKDQSFEIKNVEEAIGKAQNHTIICGYLSWHEARPLETYEDEFPVTISEWVDGVSLQKYLKTGSTKSIAELLNFAEKLFEAIALLHKAGLAHLDLHAGNVMLILNNGNIEKVILIDGDNGQQIEGTLESHKIDGRIGKDTIRSWRDITNLETKAYVGAKNDMYAAGLLLQEFIGMRYYDSKIVETVAEVTDFIWRKRNEIRKESKTANKELEIKDYDTLLQPIHDFLSELKLYEIATLLKPSSDTQNNSYEKIQQVLNTLAFLMVKQKPKVLSDQYPNDIQLFINAFSKRDANELTLTAETVLQNIKDLKKKHHRARVPNLAALRQQENKNPGEIVELSSATHLDDENLPNQALSLARSFTTNT